MTRNYSIDAAHLENQRRWSEATFGPGARTLGVIDHIRKELAEIEADPEDLFEWVDVVILAFDGAWRAGWGPQQIIDAIREKQARNEARTWPDWRTAPADKAIEHVAEGPMPCRDTRCSEQAHPAEPAETRAKPTGCPVCLGESPKFAWTAGEWLRMCEKHKSTCFTGPNGEPL